MLLKLIADVLDIGINLVVLCLKSFNLVGALLKDALKALICLFDIEALELCNKACKILKGEIWSKFVRIKRKN